MLNAMAKGLDIITSRFLYFCLMQSFKLSTNDKDRIFEDGFSGSVAVKARKSGHGIA